MLVVYLLLGGVLCWLAIKSFSVACRRHEEDEHALLAEVDLKIQNEEHDLVSENYHHEWLSSSEYEFSTDWCPAELTIKVK